MTKIKSKTLTAKIETPNKLYYGDNLEVLRKYIKDESVDLCYIDPPFNSNRDYNQIYLNQGKEDKAQAHAFTDTWEWDEIAKKGFDEILSNEKNRFSAQTVLLIEGLGKVLGKDSLLAYIVHITLRVTEIHRVLKDTGSFYLHCDPTASHYLKIVLDSIFCTKGGNIRNEIIWHYEKWTSPSKIQFQRNHDVIFFYSKNKNNTFNVIKEVTDNLKEKYKKGYLLGGGGGSTGLVVYDEENPKVKELIASGKYNVVYAKQNGKPISDVWTIPFINPMAKERLGYPTQKPEALLDKIVRASSKEGDVILDAYCGCGTTVAVAEKLKRNWIGIDITYQSVSLIMKRLEDTIGKASLSKIELNGVPEDWESAKALAEKEDDRTRKEFEKWAVLFYSNNRAMVNEKKGGDGGIDGISLIQDRDEKSDVINKKIIYSVKSDKTLIPAYINQLKGKMHDEDVVMGIFICLYEPTKGMLKEAKDMGTYKNKLFNIEYPKLQIISIKDMFDKGERLSIPMVEITKKAEYKGKADDQVMLFDEE